MSTLSNFKNTPKKTARYFRNRYSCVFCFPHVSLAFPDGSEAENLPASAGDEGSIPGSERSPGEENGNSSVLAWEIPRTGAWQATVHGVAESDTT